MYFCILFVVYLTTPFSNLDYMASNDNWKGCGIKRSWPILRHYLGIRLETLRKPP
jgi:hypothetical protein